MCSHHTVYYFLMEMSHMCKHVGVPGRSTVKWKGFGSYLFSALWCLQSKLNAPGLKSGVPTTNMEKENNVSVWGDI